MSTFVDQHHIEQIRKRLWCGREFGQAAVFVGAGFSRNARPISASTPPFALWSDITGKMFDTLYPESSFETTNLRAQARLRATSGNGVLRMAQEFELALGPQALEDLVYQSIPDHDYQPGRLHELLLSLPWSDVFTTNYDTLLERTSSRITDKKYDLVLTASDIPGAMKPRIVKLHGSFPSIRPFILTEEDFRTYPSNFGPFVNTVQQAIMENSLCLLGFSGDDPNFLYWSGWVRDNLGPSAPPIYLIGLLDISASQRKVLESRKVIPIDLSPLFPVSKWLVPDIRHQKAVEWFLLTLLEGEPPATHNWPKQRPISSWEPSEGLPPIPRGPAPLLGPGPRRPDSAKITPEALLDLGSTWRAIRLQYPGWIIFPDPNRSDLWDHTIQWIGPLLNTLDNLTAPQRLELLFELHWRISTCLRPLPAEFLKKAEAVLSEVNPAPTLLPLSATGVIPADTDEIDWGRAAECWVGLAFALARHARDRQDENVFGGWIAKLKDISKQRSDWHLQWQYEQCLYWLNYGSLSKLRERVEAWPSHPEDPTWELHRAAILAEMGEMSEARGTAEKALVEIRSRIRPNAVDYGLLSQEGWAMLLLEIIRSLPWSTESSRGAFRNRWEKLGAYKCNPWALLDQVEAGLLKATAEPRSGDDLDSAYSLLRLLEQACIPIRCGSVVVRGDVVITAAKRIFRFFPLWSLNTLLRAGKDREIRDWFDQTRIASLSAKNVLELCDRLLCQIKEAANDVVRRGSVTFWSPSLSQRQLTTLCELLSTLCFRLSTEQKHAVVDLACALYRTPSIRENIFHNSVESLYKSLMPQLLPHELTSKIQQLLDLPLPGENGFEVGQPETWPEPLRYARWGADPLPSDAPWDEWATSIRALVNVVNTGTPEARSRAVIRLNFLYHTGALQGETATSYGDALWSRIGLDGFPSDTGFYKFAFLHLPCPDVEHAKDLYKSFILSGDFHRSVTRVPQADGTVSTSFGIGSDDDAYAYELLGSADKFASADPVITLSGTEAQDILRKAGDWWRSEGISFFSNPFMDLFGEGARRVTMLVRVLSRVIIPSLTGTHSHTTANTFIEELDNCGVCILAALPSALCLSTECLETVTRRLRLGLNDLKRETVAEAVEGVYIWLAAHSSCQIPEPPPDLIKECVDIVASRRQPGLDSALSIVTDMIGRFPGYFLSHLPALGLALEYLEGATRLPSVDETDTFGEHGSPIPKEERLRYRTLAARLAASIKWSVGPIASTGIAPILEKWRSIAQASDIATLKRAWL